MDTDLTNLAAFSSAEPSLLDTLLNVSLTGIILFEPVYNPQKGNELIDLAYVHLNPAAQDMLRLPPRPASTFLSLYPHALEEGIFAFYRDTFLLGKPGRYEVNYSHDGLDNYFQLAAQRSGSLLVVSFTDTAEQDRSPVEVALRKSQDREQQARAEAQQAFSRLERLLMQAPVAIAVFKGPQYIIELANPAVLSLWGRSSQQAMNTPLFDLLPEVAGQGFEELLDGVMATGEPYVAHERPSYIDRHGQRDTVYWNFVYQPWREELGRITGVMVVATEVTEQVIARQQLQALNAHLEARVAQRTQELHAAWQQTEQQRQQLFQQQGFLQAILGQVPASVAVLTGPKHHHRFFNTYYQTLSGERAQLDLTVAEVFPEAVEQGFINLLDEVYATGKPFIGTETLAVLYDPLAGQSQQRYLDFIYQPLLNEQGQPQGILAFAIDVTDKVLARQQLQALNAELEVRVVQRTQEALAAQAEADLQRQHLHHILMQAPAMICIFEGPDHVFGFVNPPYQQLVGERPLLGKPIAEAMPELQGQPTFGLLDSVYQSGESFYAYEQLVQLDHTNSGQLGENYYNFIYQAIRNLQGDIDGILVFAYEVTTQVAARQLVQTLNEELTAANEELRATNEELSESKQVMEQFVGELDARVIERTREVTLAQQEVLRQRERLERFFQQAPAGICVLDGPNLVFELVNPGYQAFFPGRALVGLPVYEALPEIVGAPISAILSQVYQTGETFYGREVPIWLARYEGTAPEELFFNFIYQARFNEQGAVDGLLVFVFEVTEAVLTRKKAEESSMRFQMLTEALPQIIWTATPDGLLDYFSAHWWSYAGLSFEQSKGEGWASTIHPDDLPTLAGHWAHCLQTGQPYEVEARIKRVDEVYRWFLIRALPLHNEKEQIIQWVGTCTDLDDQKRTAVQLQHLSQELALTNDELTAANEEIRASNDELSGANVKLLRINSDLDNFIYTASHDLKAPISNIEGLMTVLKRQLSPENLQNTRISKPFELIEASIGRFKKTIADLTSITQLQKESNQQVTEIALADIVEEVRLDLENQFAQTDARLEVDVSGCPTVRFSQKNLRSIVYNLLSNAVKYRSQQRVPRISVHCHQAGDWQILTVRDNGLGMDLAKESKVFAMFGRLHDHVEGSGIGLYMVKKMVENAGGRIEVESQVEVGSTFRVYFPLGGTLHG